MFGVNSFVSTVSTGKVVLANKLPWCFSCALLMFFLIFKNTLANANCFDAPHDERLINYCLTQSVKGKVIDSKMANFIDYRLRQAGFFYGFSGFDSDNVVDRFSYNFHLTPILDYSININGGYKKEGLEALQRDPNKKRRKGLVVGVELGNSGKLMYGDGSYASYYLMASKKLSLSSSDEIDSRLFNLCSINNINSTWYLDMCFNYNEQKKTLTTDDNKIFSTAISKMFAAGKNNYHRLQFKVDYTFPDSSSMNQETRRKYTFSLYSINQNGITSTLSLSKGKQIKDLSSYRFGGSLRVNIPFSKFNKPLSISLRGNDTYVGQDLVRKKMQTTSYTASIALPFFEFVTLGFGYSKQLSTQAYYRESFPFLIFDFDSIF